MATLDGEKLKRLVELSAEANSAQLFVHQSGASLLDEVWSTDPVDVFAVQKGVLTLLVGIAEEKYLLETLDHINHHLAPEWTQLSPWDEAKLSIETLLTMTTGMDDELSLLGEINKTWRYNNTAYQYLKEILREQSDMSLQALSEDWLFKPLGLEQTAWIDRDQKTPLGRPFSGLLSTASDLAKIGRMVLQEGSFEGQVLVPEYFIDAMSSPGSDENPAWGWGWWNNHSAHYVKPMREPKRIDGPLIPDAPKDLIAARGAYGNYLWVVPSLELVIARTSQPATEKPTRDYEQDLWHCLS